jgi:hypothetical protein
MVWPRILFMEKNIENVEIWEVTLKESFIKIRNKMRNLKVI